MDTKVIATRVAAISEIAKKGKMHFAFSLSVNYNRAEAYVFEKPDNTWTVGECIFQKTYPMSDEGIMSLLDESEGFVKTWRDSQVAKLEKEIELAKARISDAQKELDNLKVSAL